MQDTAKGEGERLAAMVHQAYLDTCARLGWPVKPENQVPYEALSEESKELDRASVQAVLNALSKPEAVECEHEWFVDENYHPPVRCRKCPAAKIGNHIWMPISSKDGE